MTVVLAIAVAVACVQAIRQWWSGVLTREDERFERDRPWLTRPRRSVGSRR